MEPETSSGVALPVRLYSLRHETGMESQNM